jgi:hypothetical protein
MESDKYKKAVDKIYLAMEEIHDDRMKEHVSGLLTLILPRDGDPRRGVVQALFDDNKNKRIDLLRNMYKLFSIMLCSMGVTLEDAKSELANSYNKKGGDC